MSPERTTPTAPTATAPPRGAAKEAPTAGGFAELLDAAAETPAPTRDELTSDSEVNPSLASETPAIPIAIVPVAAPPAAAAPVAPPGPNPATAPALGAVFEPVAAPNPGVVPGSIEMPAAATGDAPDSLAPGVVPVASEPGIVSGSSASSVESGLVATGEVSSSDAPRSVPVSVEPRVVPVSVEPEAGVPTSVAIPAAPAPPAVSKPVEIPAAAPAAGAPPAGAPPADAPPAADPDRAPALPADLKPQPPLVADRPPAPHRAAPLHEAPRAVAQLLQLAVDRDISRAKLHLRPAELGGVEIRLQASAAGVTARVVADSPAAAALLNQAADDLRRSLERHDVTLLSLDVSTSGDGRPHHGGDRRDTNQPHPDEPQATPTTVRLPDGLLVDVLA